LPFALDSVRFFDLHSVREIDTKPARFLTGLLLRSERQRGAEKETDQEESGHAHRI